MVDNKKKHPPHDGYIRKKYITHKDEQYDTSQLSSSFEISFFNICHFPFIHALVRHLSHVLICGQGLIKILNFKVKYQFLLNWLPAKYNWYLNKVLLKKH